MLQNLDNQLPIVNREVTPVEIVAINLGLKDLTNIVETGIKHYL